MKRVAVFGNTGAGKSTLARRLAELTGIPLFPLDLIQWRPGDVKVPHDEYLQKHADILARPAWIIDGYGCRKSAWERFAAADTLVYIDLPLVTHAWWVTKRLVRAPWVTPEGWPAGSRIVRSTLGCYRTMWLCHRRLTPDYRKLVADVRGEKRVHHLKSAAEIAGFVQAVAKDPTGSGPTALTVRDFRDRDEEALYAVFHSAIHTLAAREYTPEQLGAWAPERPELTPWTERMRVLRPFVVEDDGRIVGYADLQPSGYIDHFYVAGPAARRGVGRALMQRIHARATELELTQLFADVSLTAEGFFERFGFRLVERKLVDVRGAKLRNARMVKDLSSR